MPWQSFDCPHCGGRSAWSICICFTTSFTSPLIAFCILGRIEGVSDAGPYEFSLLRRDHIEVSLDAYLLFFPQVVGRVDYGVYRAVVSVKRVVVGEGSNVGAAWDICDGIVNLDQARTLRPHQSGSPGPAS
jgi:hypothetical protein